MTEIPVIRHPEMKHEARYWRDIFRIRDMIYFSCPHCAKQNEAAEGGSGSRASCFACNYELIVPAFSGRLKWRTVLFRDGR
jgi:hypothetical protein